MKRLILFWLLTTLVFAQTTTRNAVHRNKQRGTGNTNYTKLWQFTGMSNVITGVNFENPAGTCGGNAGAQQRGATATRPYPGTSYSIEQYYAVDPLGTNGCTDHQDNNMHIEYLTPDYPNGPGYQWIGIDTYVYVAPDTGAGTYTNNVQRKLFWAGLGYVQGSTYPPNAGYRAVITSDGNDTNIGMRFTAQGNPTTGPSGSMGGGHSEVAPSCTNPAWGGQCWNYNTWYRMTVMVKRRTDYSHRDSEIWFYLDGVLRFKKTNTWSPDDVTLCPQPNGSGSSQICVPMPGDDNYTFPNGWTWFWFGSQVDRVSSATTPTIRESRFWGPTTICGSNGTLADMKACLGL